MHCTKLFYIKLIVQCFIIILLYVDGVDGKWLNISSYFKELVPFVSVFVAMKEVLSIILCFIVPYHEDGY